MDESDQTIESNSVESAGAYQIITDNSEKKVIAVRESDGKVLGYGRVIPTAI